MMGNIVSVQNAKMNYYPEIDVVDLKPKWMRYQLGHVAKI